MDAKELIEEAMKATGLDVEALGERLGYKSLRRAMWGEIPLPESKRKHIEDVVRLHKLEMQTQGSFTTHTVVRMREGEDVDIVVSPTPRGKLQDALKKLRLTPATLAKKMGYSQGVVENVVNGSGKISEKMAGDLETALEHQVSKEDLLGGSDFPTILDESGTTGTRGAKPNIKLPPNHRGRMVPLLSMVQAGRYNVAHSDEFYDQGAALAIDNDDRQAFAVEIDGDSMSPRLNPGDIVICAPNAQPRVGDMVLVQTIDGGAYCKIWQRQKSGDTLVLASINPLSPTFEIPRSEVAWIYPVDSTIQKLRRK